VKESQSLYEAGTAHHRTRSARLGVISAATTLYGRDVHTACGGWRLGSGVQRLRGGWVSASGSARSPRSPS
jgi:hypothetical protein